MVGDSPQIEKDIAKKLVLTYRNKVLSEVRVILTKFDSHEPEPLEYWNKVMRVFADASLADDPEFNAYKEQLLKRWGSQPVDSLKASHLGILKKELQAAFRQDSHSPRASKDVGRMLHANSLRAIGQSLATLRLKSI